jgi:uncharacterized protein with FMN-binding domain
MNTQSPQPTSKPGRFFRKFFLSAFVVFSFIAYAISKPFFDSQGGLSQILPTPTVLVTQPVSTSTLTGSADTPGATQPDSTSTATVSTATTEAPTQVVVVPTAVPAGLYKDGTYNGPTVDAFYGYVQVQVVIQNGRIANVTFLQFPSDRRTSQRINSVAVPYLQQEAVQAQNANVNIVTGATLTSEGFIQSLQSALANAKN